MTRINVNQKWDINGNLVFEEVVEHQHSPLGPNGVFATLNAVLGIWSLSDAARAVQLPEDFLILEAQSWAAAQMLES